MKMAEPKVLATTESGELQIPAGVHARGPMPGSVWNTMGRLCG